MYKAVCGGDFDGFCKGLGGIRPCPDHAALILGARTEPKPKRHIQDAGHAAHPGFENCEDESHYEEDRDE